MPSTFSPGAFTFDWVTDVVILLERLSRVPLVVADGAASASLEVSLPRNAVVRRFDLVVQAKQATGVALRTVAQVRGGTEETTDDVVVDFRMLRTVSGFQAPEGGLVTAVFPWTGAAFAPQAVWPAGGDTPAARTVVFPEVRTERLRVRLGPQPVLLATLEAQGLVVLPEAPADLELRIDGGPPVWTHPGPVVPGTAETPTDSAWDINGLRLVSLKDAFAPLVGDPLGSGEATFKVSLSSRSPGVLSLLAADPELSFISRAAVAGSAAGEVELEAEGRLEVPLELPPLQNAGRLVEEVRFTLIGTPPEERAVGPIDPYTADPDLPYAADLVADPDHAFSVLLPSRPELAELTAVRLPLAPGPTGAEARVVLWEGSDAPATALDNGASEPVSLAVAPPVAGESWVTFPFQRPVPLDEDHPLWAALVASRGSVVWGLGAAAVGDDPREAPRTLEQLRRGGPAGPWRPLPAALAVLEPGGLRVRAVGNPGKTPLPLLRVGLEGAPAAAGVEVTPAPKGVTVVLPFTEAVAADVPKLVLTGRAAVDLTLRDVDVVWRPSVIA